ncbi:hypothetical protein CU098_006286 [Rhizopus stolonifer]|uniref:Uncharacterized protein n=1 Tax=Rhizopus stolonifer TaxID=4846 RepID=A0A367IQ58_RHIST|nr:hypothetical protein CU098_006286 [Rhizopus stolonifer]
MQRRNTIDSVQSTWPMCHYYYTHNNGSSDDILIHQRPRSDFMTRKKQPLSSSYKGVKRFYTYPPFSRSAFLSPKRSLPNKKYHNDLRAAFYANTSLRKYKSRQQNQKKRQTLSNILTALTQGSSCPTMGLGNISKNNRHDLIDTVHMQTKWDSIRLYHPQLDNEKIQQDMEQEDIILDLQRTRRNQHDMIAVNQALHEPPHTPAGQEEEEQQSIIIQIPTPSDMVPVSKTVYFSSKDMYLFLFGFLFFPLWWYGAWRYFACDPTMRMFMSKRQQAFQMLNIFTSLASLLLTGLIVGLVTVWTQ